MLLCGFPFSVLSLDTGTVLVRYFILLRRRSSKAAQLSSSTGTDDFQLQLWGIQYLLTSEKAFALSKLQLQLNLVEVIL